MSETSLGHAAAPVVHSATMSTAVSSIAKPNHIPTTVCIYCRHNTLECGNRLTCSSCARHQVSCQYKRKRGRPRKEPDRTLPVTPCISCRQTTSTCDGRSPCSTCSSQKELCQYEKRKRGRPRLLETEAVKQKDKRRSTSPRVWLQGWFASTLWQHGAEHHPTYTAEKSTYVEQLAKAVCSMSEQITFTTTLMSSHATSMRSKAPLRMLHSISADHIAGRKIAPSVVDAAKEWTMGLDACAATAHACSCYTIAQEAVTCISPWPTTLTELAQEALQDGAVIVWIYAGLHSIRSQREAVDPKQSTPYLRRLEADGGVLQICRENVFKTLIDFALLRKNINKDEIVSISSPILGMAVNPLPSYFT